MQTLFGKMRYSRGYYHCHGCHRGNFPADVRFGIQRKQSLAARELETLAGVLHPFAEGAEQVLERMSGIRVSAATVQRTTEAEGTEIVAAQQATVTAEPPRDTWTWATDIAGETVGYVSLDATSVPQQGRHAERVEGRMPYVAAVFNPQVRRVRQRAARRLWDVHYLAGLMNLDEVGRRLRREALAVGLDRCAHVICLTDGGNGLEDCLQGALAGVVPQVQFILDFHHVTDRLTEFAKLFWADDSPTRQHRTDDWCHQLKTAGGEKLLRSLEQLDLSAAAAYIVDSHRLLTGYLRSNLHRMDYPQYLAQGWQIGSGIIESACKTVVCRRLKQSGMRWREPGTNSLCHLRALYLSSDQHWERYWSRAALSQNHF